MFDAEIFSAVSILMRIDFFMFVCYSTTEDEVPIEINRSFGDVFKIFY